MRCLVILVVIVLFGSACNESQPAYDHSLAHPKGHDHHAKGHGHGDVPVTTMTLWSDQFEVFAESHSATPGKPVSLLVHVTELDGFRPLKSGTLTVQLDGPARLQGSTSKTFLPGIFELSITPQKAGHYRGSLRIDGTTSSVVEGIELVVQANDQTGTQDDHGHAHEEHGDHGPANHDDHNGLIEFLKEQQWGVPFGTAFARLGVITPVVRVAGRVEAAPGGIADVSAPMVGQLRPPAGGFPMPGSQIAADQTLAILLPAPPSAEAIADARVRLSRSTAQVAAANKALARARRLVNDHALPLRDLEAAEREQVVAQTAQATARQIIASYTGKPSANSWPLRAPIAGTMVDVHARLGSGTTPGMVLFTIVDMTQLWVVAQVPEHQVTDLRKDGMLSFRAAGDPAWRTLQTSGESPGAILLGTGRSVAPKTRTVDVIYAIDKKVADLRIRGLLDVSLPAGPEVHGVVVPDRAVIDRDGRSVVYVQIDGEHFAERTVRVGPKAAGQVLIESGLRAGERVVTTGAHLIHLAERSKDEQPHGHIH
jgi:membrane fusion protein, heavy metal efflux system